MGWMSRRPAEPGFSNDLSRSVREWRDKASLCPRPELLHAAQAGVLPPEQGQGILEHLESCELCKSLLADLETLDNAGLDKAGANRIWTQVQEGTAGAKRARTGALAAWREFWLRPLPVAVALALVVAIIGVRLAREFRKTGAPIAESRPTAPAPPSVFRLEKAPVLLPGSAVIVWRGQVDASRGQAKDLKQALAPYEKENYAEAARRLVSLRERYPHMAEAPFYLGICQLFLAQDEAATKSLKEAVNLASPTLADDAAWYLALADYRTGRLDLAMSLLEPVCRPGGDKSARACAGVKEIKARY
jgi:tetratricopeptide (TPR) repeat protein